MMTDSADHVESRVAPTALRLLQILDIIERYKAKKKQREEEELMALHGSFSIPVSGELADSYILPRVQPGRRGFTSTSPTELGMHQLGVLIDGTRSVQSSALFNNSAPIVASR